MMRKGEVKDMGVMIREKHTKLHPGGVAGLIGAFRAGILVGSSFDDWLST